MKSFDLSSLSSNLYIQLKKANTSGQFNVYTLAPFLILATCITQILLVKNTKLFQHYFLMTGQMSYALYVIHFPIIRVVEFLAVSLGVKLILVIRISVILAYVLEFYLHPPIARQILGCSRTNK